MLNNITSIIFDACYTLCDVDTRSIYLDVEPTLKDLKSKGLKLYVVSNWDDESFDACGGKPLRPYFDQLLFTGIHKEEVTKSLVGDSDPNTWVTVGDDLNREIAIGKRLGLVTVWLNRSGLRPPADAIQPEFEIHLLGELTKVVE